MKNRYLVIFMPSIEGGGEEKNLFIIANHLSLKNNNIKLITATSGFDQKFKNIDIIKPKLHLLKITSRKFRYIISLLELLKLIISGKDLTVFSFQANLYCIILCKIFKKKIIIRSNSSPSGWSKNPIKRFIFKYLFGQADKIIVNSIDFKRQFKVIFNINAKCIYNPLNKREIIELSKKKIDFPFFDNNKNLIKIINIGRFTDQKDHLTLLRAVNYIKELLPIKLLIIGRGIKLKKMNDFIKKNNIQSNIKILDFKLNPFPYLKKSNLFVLTSRFEGLPNVLLEAAALKKFIISTDCPTGPREILKKGKNGFLCKIEDYKNIARKIILFKKTKKTKKIKNMINYNYNNLDRFDYDKNLNIYSKEINKILNNF